MGMTCKDCLFDKVCYLVEHYGVDLTEDGVEYDCDQFLDRNKYAKVVRCKDCRYLQHDSNGYWCFNDYEHNLQLDDFCSYGERKDNETV